MGGAQQLAQTKHTPTGQQHTHTDASTAHTRTMPEDSHQGEGAVHTQQTPHDQHSSNSESPRREESSANASGAHTPAETGGATDDSQRALTPTNQSTTASSSSSASPLNAHQQQVEGRPSPPPGLSPQHADALKQQQFTYNGRQMQVLPNVQAQMQAAAVAQQQHQMMLAAQMHQMHLAQQMQQQMQMQAAQQQAARQSRGERRQPNARYSGPNPGHFFAQQSAQQAAAQAAQMMSYEMYQQMLFSSGTVDAATLAAGIASGSLYQMYVAHVASIAAPFFAAQHAPPPHMHAHQPDAYAMHMQQQQHQHQQAFYGQQDNGAQQQQPQPHQLAPQQQQQQQLAQAQAQAQQQLQQQQQQHQQPPQAHFRQPKHTPTPLLPSPAVYTGEQGGAYSPAHAQNQQQQPMSYPPLSHSPPPSHDQMVPPPQHSPTAGRHFRESSLHHAQQLSERHHGGHSHRSHHARHNSNAETGAPYEKSTPQPNTFKTEICRSYQASGSCEYGSSCQFSHGAHELRSREVDSKFKSELCKNFHAPANMQRTAPDGSILPLTPPAHVPHGAQPAVAPGGTGGSCWYGNRCRFLHDEFRIRHSAGEFWLVAPSDRLIRVERVDESNTLRIDQLMELVQSDHNKRQTMIYANSIPGATNANPATGTPGTALNMPAWTQHMAQQMQHQLASQGEAQIHVREERSGARKEEREREREGHFRHNSQHHHAAMHAPAIGGDSAVHDALLASAVAARILPSRVVAITPIMPLSHATSTNSAHPTPSNSPPPPQAQQQQVQAPTPAVQAAAPQPQQPAPRSYASKVSAAPPVVAAAPAPVATPAVAAAAPLVKPAAVRVQAAPAAAPIVSNAPAVWQTKVGRRGHKGRSTTTDSSESSPDGKRAHSDDAHESAADVDGKQSQAESDEADLSHIISKIDELESKAGMEQKENARIAHNMD